MCSTDADVAKVTARLAGAFGAIHRERMAGLPIVHPRLRVAVVGGRRWQGHWLGVLVTPWCMNLVLVPAAGSHLAAGPSGRSCELAFPAGRYALTASSVDGVGPIVSCSLFSPMQAFADQAAAEATAAAVMTGLLQPGADAPEACADTRDRGTAAIRHAPGGAGRGHAAAEPRPAARAGVSRRDLLKGSFRRR